MTKVTINFNFRIGVSIYTRTQNSKAYFRHNISSHLDTDQWLSAMVLYRSFYSFTLGMVCHLATVLGLQGNVKCTKYYCRMNMVTRY